MSVPTQVQDRRRVIADAWRRSELSGLAPAAPPPQRPVETDPESRLLRAARPVLAEAEDELRGTALALVLADRDARVVHRHVAGRRLERHLDGLGVVPGVRFSEDLTGANSIATTHELRRGVAVLGEEHYLEELRRYGCFGHPVFDPLTRRLEGVLDVTCEVGQLSPVLGPYLAQLARRIEERLLADARPGQLRLLAAYQVATSPDRGRAVVAVGSDVVVANPAAGRLLSGEDVALLQVLAAESATGPAGGRRAAPLRLTGSGGGLLVADVVAVPGGDGIVVTVRRDDEVRSPATGPATPASSAATGAPRWFLGEPGSGRTTAALADAGPGAVRHAGLDVDRVGVTAWLAAVRADLARPATVVLDDVDLLDDGALRRLRGAVGDGAGRVLVTSRGTGEPGSELAAFAAGFADQVELVPLRRDRGRVPALVGDLLAELAPGRDLHLAPTLLTCLAQAPWPGNVGELRAVVAALVRAAPSGPATLTTADLPPRYRETGTGRALGPLERAERDTIVAALHAAGGNKVRAARELGIARATLYTRLRALRIDG